MQKKNFIIYGVVLLAISYFLLLCAFYILNRENKTSTGLREVLEAEKSNYTEQSKEVLIKIVQYRDESKPPEAVVRPSSPQGGKRPVEKEGILWINRELSTCIITLGTNDGLENGMLIDIYDGKIKAGKARVIQMYNTISYVELVGKTQDEFTKDCYKANILIGTLQVK